MEVEIYMSPTRAILRCEECAHIFMDSDTVYQLEVDELWARMIEHNDNHIMDDHVIEE